MIMPRRRVVDSDKRTVPACMFEWFSGKHPAFYLAHESPFAEILCAHNVMLMT